MNEVNVFMNQFYGLIVFAPKFSVNVFDMYLILIGCE